MSSRGKESTKDDQNDVPPNSSPTPLRSEAVISADKLSKTAGAIKWSRPPGLSGPEKTADHAIMASCRCADDLVSAPAYERSQSYKLWGRTHTYLLDSQAPPAESGSEEGTSCEEIALRPRERICGIGDILGQTQGVANVFP